MLLFALAILFSRHASASSWTPRDWEEESFEEQS